MRSETDVLVVGGGPVGLTLALELQRRGVAYVAIDQRPQPEYYCKALGVTPRTLEVWHQTGVLEDALRRGSFLLGIRGGVNREDTSCEAVQLGSMPYGFLTIAQYDTEEVLREHLLRHGGRVEQGTRLLGFTATADGYVARLAAADGSERELACRYLCGCDGAHSTVRKGLGIDYEGDAYPMTFVLGDVCVRWDRPHRYGYRFTHLEDGELRNIVVCIPIPGDEQRYRISAAAPPEMQEEHAPVHEPPSLEVLTEIAAPILPGGTELSDLRWSSYYRISHRIVPRYASGQAFLAGDAAHIHPPIGGQGMNTGIQDAYNLGWKLALATRGRAAPDLLESYDAERRPAGLDVVNRTTRRMDASLETGEVKFDQWMEDSQLLVAYRDSRWVAEDVPEGKMARGPRPGERAPDAALRRPWVAAPVRLAELLREPGHVLLLFFGERATREDFARAAQLVDALERRHGRDVVGYGVVARGAEEVERERLPLLEDAWGELARAYDASEPCLYLVRPDRHVGYRAAGHDRERLERYLARVLA